MAFTYVAGTATPNLAGLAEIGSIRLNNDGTYELHRLGGVLDGSPDVRDATYPLPNDDGGVAGLPLLSPRLITIEGQLTVPTLADVWGAIDLLKASFNIGLVWLQTLQTMTINTTGWANKRQMLVQPRTVTIEEPDGLAKLVPDRLFTVTAIAPDPLMYNADTLQAVTIGSSSTNLTNNGNAPTPFVLRINGPRTNPVLTGPGITGLQIVYTGAIASGHYVEIGTNPAGDGTGLYAVDDLGANVVANLDTFTARRIPAGVSAWAVSSSAGAGAVVMSFRDAWY